MNDLSPAETERLAILSEECGEVVQIIGKILRYGYEEYHPQSYETNRSGLSREIGDLQTMINMMLVNGDIDRLKFENAKEQKVNSLSTWCREKHILPSFRKIK